MSETAKEIRKHSRRMWVAIGILLVLIFANFSIAIAHPNDTTQTILGPVGPVGPAGPKPTPEQIGEAVDEYCKRTGSCEGKSPSLDTVLTAVSQYCSNGKCIGPAGTKGADAEPITPTQLLAAVSAYCADGRCRGNDGNNGTNGVNGPPPDLRSNDENHSIEWRVAGDPDWHILVYYCQLTNTCVPTGTAD